MRLSSYFLLALSAIACASAVAQEPQTSASFEVSRTPYAADKFTPHMSRIGDSEVFVYQVKGGSLGAFLLGGALLNGSLMSKETERVANSLDASKSGSLAAALEAELKSHGFSQPLSISTAIILTNDADGITRSSAIASAPSKSGASMTYLFHFEQTIETAKLESEGHSYFRSVADSLPQAAKGLAAALTAAGEGTEKGHIKSPFLKIYGKFEAAFEAQKVGASEGYDLFLVGKPNAVSTSPTAYGIHAFRPNQYSFTK